ncbi:MAG: hypothetical protein WA748_20720 [Candidatus Acidiferrum sp.]
MRPGPKPRADAAERRKKNVAAAMRRYRAANRNRINADRNGKADRNKTRLGKIAGWDQNAGVFVTHKLGLERPALLWMDAHGNLHREEWESPEELCRRLLKEERCRKEHQHQRQTATKPE